MASSLVSIYRIAASNSVQKYRNMFACTHDARIILTALHHGRHSASTVFWSTHFDPSSIAITDGAIRYILSPLTGLIYKQIKSNDSEALLIESQQSHSFAIYANRIKTASSIELGVLSSLLIAAFGFWDQLLSTHNIESVVIISIDTLGPSLYSDDLLRALASDQGEPDFTG